MAFILTITNEPAGVGSVLASPPGISVGPGKRSYEPFTTVTLTAIVNVTGAFFDHWKGDLSGTDPVKVIEMTHDWDITLVFGVEEVPGFPTFELTTGVMGMGSVSPSSGIFNQDDQIILVASPGEGYGFSQWSGNLAGASPVPGMPNHLSVTMDRDRHIVAEFEKVAALPPSPDFFFLEINTVGLGAVSREPFQNAYEPGTIVILTATPSPGYRFTQWRGDISGTNPTGFPILMDEDKIVEAVFEQVTAPTPPPPPPEEPEFRNLTTSISKSG